MNNNKCLIVLLMVFVAACNNGNNANYQQFIQSEVDLQEVIPSFLYDSSYLMVVGDSSKKYRVVFESDDKLLSFEKNCDAFKPIHINSLLKNNNDKVNSIAYKIFKDGCVNFKIRVPSNAVDTTITVKYEVKDIINADVTLPKAKIISGEAAVLQTKEEDITTKTEIRRWLYQQQHNLNDDEIAELLSIKNYLLRTDFYEYVTNGEIPVLTSLANIYYDIETDMEADYYYLFACKNDNEIENFVEDVVALDFEGASNITQKMSCYRTKGEGGTLCVFLIGINKNWEKCISPIGVVTIDNISPTISSDNKTILFGDLQNTEKSDKEFSFNTIKAKIVVHNIQPIEGSVHISTGDFRGDRVPFTFEFCGDIKNVSIKRETRSDYSYLKRETKTIELYGKESPLHISYELDLGIGDNKIPIKITDIRGNSSELYYSIKMVYTESSKPEINIENNIDIYN